MTNEKVQSLEKRIAERIKFLKKVVKFAIDAVSKYGTASKCSACNRCASYYVDDFDGFSFTFVQGHGSEEKSHILIWYGRSSSAVLFFEWNDDDSEVLSFLDNEGWQKAILDVIKKRGKEVTKKLKNSVKKAKQRSLKEEAFRLKVI